MSWGFPTAAVRTAEIAATATTVVAPAVGAALKKDDVLVVIVGWGSGTDIIDNCTPSDNTGAGNAYQACKLSQDTGNAQCFGMWITRLQADGTPTVTATFDITRPHRSITVIPIRGMDTLIDLATIGLNSTANFDSNGGSGRTDPTATSLTPNQNNALLIGHVAETSGIALTTLTTANNEVFETATGDRMAAATIEQQVRTSQAHSWTASGLGFWAMNQVALPPVQPEPDSGGRKIFGPDPEQPYSGNLR